jgi:hypothetical protein
LKAGTKRFSLAVEKETQLTYFVEDIQLMAKHSSLSQAEFQTTCGRRDYLKSAKGFPISA